MKGQFHYPSYHFAEPFFFSACQPVIKVECDGWGPGIIAPTTKKPRNWWVWCRRPAVLRPTDFQASRVFLARHFYSSTTQVRRFLEGWKGTGEGWENSAIRTGQEQALRYLPTYYEVAPFPHSLLPLSLNRSYPACTEKWPRR